ncbi:amidophosphoribosyltransferase [Pasteurella multocida]|uniref:Amidophosphoribosyltransferase n=1 Tax=Pasteurella multocida (strain Pm70) TaxID=272843 RepID=PUR1_PASMU|nr:amidophosphoribosyltransferase [Pasteurella multocida]Q9L6B8.3 RecName: Full=Amidophosphoribosyltransferase; Short=ATase; AltName: Full=Glutamine phosphoribosylpyrophosphate amidotransferase; Short=GPATase [Pasteurella multocida subsp. multocida str. Pm70]AAK02785.1 PurF [Pasteurella multocida subsp. multocida str. Pm70]ATF74030.1 amidophosphoribosyltransferase [Pasteurella multocida]ATN16430.1 amidophosphoribosyltransferase [Pasteurella multocida]AWB53748.1 amidophosphoribosyltransferase [
MCGIVGIVSQSPVNQSIYDALTLLQHRGQDAAGIVTVDDENRFRLRKANGLVSDVFEQVHMLRLQGNAGIGHVRYPTAGSSSVSEAQPFYVNSPYGLTLVHNGNLTNSSELKEKLFRRARRHVNTNSDSELLLNILANHLDHFEKYQLDPQDVFSAVKQTHQDIRGAYACIAMIIGHGMVAFRDPNGIRPLVLGKREENGKTEYMFASESIALDTVGFEFVRDVQPGEAIYVTFEGEMYAQQCADKPTLTPCIFEYVYFARPDSCIDGVSVYAARVHMGQRLGEKIAREWADVDDIDVVIPVPETSNDIALRIARVLNKPYRQGFVKNRYVGRTFIMPGQALRVSSVRRKLNTIASEFKDKNVLLVDDSIVRGTTSEQIVEMARAAGAKKIYFASAAPEIRYPNVYGIDMPTKNELIAYGRDVDEIAKLIGVDKLIFQDLDALTGSVQQENPSIQDFDCSVFTGVYVTGDITPEYLDNIAEQRNDIAKKKREKDATNLEMHNEK